MGGEWLAVSYTHLDVYKRQEQEGMVHAAAVQRIGQRTDHVLLPDKFGKTLGAPFPGEDEIGHQAAVFI